MALSFGTLTKPTKNLAGLKVRIVPITFDAAYVNADGYTVTALQCGLKKILACPGMNIAGYQIAATSYASDGASMVLRAYKGNTQAADNEAGLSTLVGRLIVWGN